MRIVTNPLFPNKNAKDCEKAKADLDTKIESTKQKKASQETELSNIKGYITQLHANCDFLIENYDLRPSENSV